jgi:hypothetical protein
MIMRFSEYLTTAKDIVTIAVAFFAAYIAWQGLSTWRRQLGGNTRYDLARRLLLSAYKVRDAVHEVRTPGMHSAEISNAMKEVGFSSDGLDERRRISVGTQAVYAVRWGKLQEAKRELHVNSLEGKVLWGDESEAAYRAVSNCTQKLWAAIVMKLELENSECIEHDHQETLKRMRVMYPAAGKPEEDEFMVALNAAIAQYEKSTRPHLTLDRGWS